MGNPVTYFFRKIRGYKLPLLALVAVIFALVTVFSRPSAPAREPIVTPPHGGFSSSVAGIGVVEPKSELIDISTELAGVVRNVPVTVGQQVKKGDPLFVLDQREIDATILRLEASLEAARIKQQDAAAKFALIASVKDKRAIAQDDYNQRRYARDFAIAEVKQIGAALNEANTTKARLTVRAPMDGQVLQVNIHPGEFASAGVVEDPPMRMGDVSTLYVRVEFDEENASLVRADAPAEGFRRGDTKTAIPLNFVRFEPYVRPKINLAVAGQRVDTRVLQVIYALPPGRKDVFVGQQMDVFVAKAPEAKK
jgi:RND family efflux transporter MFP subunit